MWVVCLVLVVVQTCARLASGNLHIEHLVARIIPKFVFLAQSRTYQLFLFLGVVLLRYLGATHHSTFIVPQATCSHFLVVALKQIMDLDLVGGTSCNVVMVHTHNKCLSASCATIYNNAIACRNHYVSMSQVVRPMCQSQVWKTSSQMPNEIGSLLQPFESCDLFC